MPSIVENSYGLAAQHVIQSIELQTSDLRIRFSDAIAVDQLENCDCVPIRVAANGWNWALRLVTNAGGGVGELTATYRAVTKLPSA